MRGRGGGADHRAGRRLGLRADPRPRGRRSSSCAARSLSARTGRCCWRRTAGSSARSRRPPPSPPRSGPARTTWCCWATRRPTPATTRSPIRLAHRLGGAGRHRHQERCAHLTAPRCWPRREYRGADEAYSAAPAVPSSRVTRGHQPAPLPVPARPAARPSSAADRPVREPESAARTGLKSAGCRVPEAGTSSRPRCSATGADAAPRAWSAVLQELGLVGCHERRCVLVEHDGPARPPTPVAAGADPGPVARPTSGRRPSGGAGDARASGRPGGRAARRTRRQRPGRRRGRLGWPGTPRSAWARAADAGLADRGRRDRRAGAPGTGPRARRPRAPRRDHRPADGGELHARHPGRRQDAPAGPAPLGRAAARGRGHGGAGRAARRGHRLGGERFRGSASGGTARTPVPRHPGARATSPSWPRPTWSVRAV